MLWSFQSAHATDSVPESGKSGKALYDFYCYQCHGYTGDGRTLAATYLEPPPRNFRAADPSVLSRERMLQALEQGRPGTAMVSFADVIDVAGRERVVDFVRTQLMAENASQRRYHTRDNGWPEHDRYAAAYPFATGEITLRDDPKLLSAAQQQGRKLYLAACVTCHDHGREAEQPLFWDLKPLSYPRRHYSHRTGHLISGASPYAVHDRRPDHGPLTPAQSAGQLLYEANCAFCHAIDGTGKNWIGRFMEPHPRDLTTAQVSAIGRAGIVDRIAEGLPGTSMPAWRGVLTPGEMEQVAEYILVVLSTDQPVAAGPEAELLRPVRLSWQKRKP